MSFGRVAILNTDHKIPTIEYGTWQLAPNEVKLGVIQALRVEYRHINQIEVGEGIKHAYKEIPGLKREDIFITTKLWNTHHRPEIVEPALNDSLEEAGLDYFDLYLMHFPGAIEPAEDTFKDLYPCVPGKNLPNGDVIIDDHVSIIDTWKAMIKLPRTKARSIGVSNFSIDQLETIITATGVVPAVNQIERHPLCRDDRLLAYCKEKGIHITAYSPLGNNVFGLPLLMDKPEVKRVAERLTAKTGATVSPAQVLIAWGKVGGHSIIPKSVTASRIAENFKEVELGEEDFAAVTDVGATYQNRYNVPYVANIPRWDINIFGDEAEKNATHKIIHRL